eukprot:3771202-Rhodomonas_salina.1
MAKGGLSRRYRVRYPGLPYPGTLGSTRTEENFEVLRVDLQPVNTNMGSPTGQVRGEKPLSLKSKTKFFPPGDPGSNRAPTAFELPSSYPTFQVILVSENKNNNSDKEAVGARLQMAWIPGYPGKDCTEPRLLPYPSYPCLG